eukprot:CAMPEP_0184359564 /NCGR_PEP_ID=MMETSP1089-20130417/120602_1 /TAXON_ID=38269 ORGANISM="Gloeochaete wittrockiana, Strain SAG46.84" /NCGR_SAMPLE_ID=MMETSP1089 /ASSEMBLY_ACC=CAM_ASM_000445 /LENGTH=92 /DNA_ID=CAMNT_0026698409 /DNA_START=129 /DNA_END=405 /DNA_ORIENTATION=+
MANRMYSPAHNIGKDDTLDIAVQFNDDAMLMPLMAIKHVRGQAGPGRARRLLPAVWHPFPSLQYYGLWETASGPFGQFENHEENFQLDDDLK